MSVGLHHEPEKDEAGEERMPPTDAAQIDRAQGRGNDEQHDVDVERKILSKRASKNIGDRPDRWDELWISVRAGWKVSLRPDQRPSVPACGKIGIVEPRR